MNLEELETYKNKLMSDICCDLEIVKLITGETNPVMPATYLPYNRVFPYQYVPETVDDARTIICFDVDIEKVINRTMYRPVIYIWILVHKSQMKIEGGGIRSDRLCNKVDSVLNASRYYGIGELELESVSRFRPILDYYGREIAYTATDWNRPDQKPVPSKRRNIKGTVVNSNQ